MRRKPNMAGQDATAREFEERFASPGSAVESEFPRSSGVARKPSMGSVDQELAASRTETLGAMTAIAVHELSNVLHWLNMSVGVVERGVEALDAKPSNLAPAVQDLRMGLNHITAIIRELRDLRRPLLSTPEAFDPGAALRTALQIAGRRVSEHASLVEEIWPVPRVCGRQHDLVCVFLNLLLNAAEAIPGGAPALNKVVVRALVDPAGAVLFEVEDTGRGIPPELVDRIFDPYVSSRLDSGGSGLGLHVCRRIVNEMGGRIGFDPTLQGGTRFWVSLPRATEE